MAGEGLKGQVLRDVSMKRYTSMRVGGTAPYLFYPADAADLAHCVNLLGKKRTPFRVLGNGTNVIVADKGVDMALIRISRVGGLRFSGTRDGATVSVSGGMALKKLIRESAERGLSGIEKLYGIPGTVGGAIKMNAGSFGVSITDSLRSVAALNGDGAVRRMDRKELTFGYRSSSFGESDCIVEALFELKHGDRTRIKAEMDHVWHERLERHPMEFPSAGSVFKNVNGKPSWKYIEQAGLRGFRIGNACVSEKHPNFIVNLGKASASDVSLLIAAVKKAVYEKTGVRLEEEVELWGFNG